jgi:Xaa-Pro aminopeptidase
MMSGFKSLGAAAVMLSQAEIILVVTPAWDEERAREACKGARVIAADDVIDGLPAEADRRAVGIVGLPALPWALAGRLLALLPQAVAADAWVYAIGATKTDDEIHNAREATRIAELTYQHMLAIVRPGMSEDELALELKWHSKTLGAEDNFLLLCAGPHNRAVQPSTGRRMQAGDIVLAEITPSYRGQLAQICRTLVLGSAGSELVRKYDLVVHAMNEGTRAAVPGVAMAAVCRAINAVLEAEGYREFCYPPHIRRRGHGLGFGAISPGDVSLDNKTALAPGMIFMIHPNQYLPETGYLLCGEPVLMTPSGAEPLTARQAALAEIKL